MIGLGSDNYKKKSVYFRVFLIPNEESFVSINWTKTLHHVFLSRRTCGSNRRDRQRAWRRSRWKDQALHQTRLERTQKGTAPPRVRKWKWNVKLGSLNQKGDVSAVFFSVFTSDRTAISSESNVTLQYNEHKLIGCVKSNQNPNLNPLLPVSTWGLPLTLYSQCSPQKVLFFMKRQKTELFQPRNMIIRCKGWQR